MDRHSLRVLTLILIREMKLVKILASYLISLVIYDDNIIIPLYYIHNKNNNEFIELLIK